MRALEWPDQAKSWQVLETIRARGAASRAQVVEDTKLPWASVTEIAKDLQRRDLLKEGGDARVGRAGRRSKLLQLSPKVGCFLGIDVGSSAIQARLLDFDFRVRDFAAGPYPTGKDLGAIRATVQEVISTALDATARDRLLGVGFAWPGVVDPEQGIALYAPNLPLAGGVTLNDLLLAGQLEQLRQKVIVFDHNTECTAIAEKEVGGLGSRPRTERQIVVVIIGTGVGAGLILDGKPYRGIGNAAGELGHIIVNEESGYKCGCGRVGCLEQEISGPALARKGRELPGMGPEVRAQDLAAAAYDGNEQARELFRQLGDWLGKGLAGVVNLLNPELIVIGGGVSGAYDLFYPALRESLERRCWRHGLESLRIERSRLGPTATAVGASISAYQQLSMMAMKKLTLSGSLVANGESRRSA